MWLISLFFQWLFSGLEKKKSSEPESALLERKERRSTKPPRHLDEYVYLDKNEIKLNIDEDQDYAPAVSFFFQQRNRSVSGYYVFLTLYLLKLLNLQKII